jgi:hypothetical protein
LGARRFIKPCSTSATRSYPNTGNTVEVSLRATRTVIPAQGAFQKLIFA